MVHRVGLDDDRQIRLSTPNTLAPANDAHSVKSGSDMVWLRWKHTKGRTAMEKAMRPEDLTRLFVKRANDGDASGIADLYEEQAVMAYPPGELTTGREAIRSLWEKVLSGSPHFEPESPLPTR
jgi:hypothetical protein